MTSIIRHKRRNPWLKTESAERRARGLSGFPPQTRSGKFLKFVRNIATVVLLCGISSGLVSAESDSFSIQSDSVRIRWLAEPDRELLVQTVDSDGNWISVSSMSGSDLYGLRTASGHGIPREDEVRWDVRRDESRLTMEVRDGKVPFRRTITLHKSDGRVHVNNAVRFQKETRLEWIRDAWTYQRPSPLDFTWVPNLRPEPDQRISNHTFRSPAIILKKEGVYAAIIPDLDTLSSCGRHHETALNLNIRDHPLPVHSYGIIRTEPLSHVYYRHDSSMVLTYEPGTYHYAYDLVVGEEEDRNEVLRRVNEYLWDRYAGEYFRSVLPQTVSFNQYAEYAYPTLLDSGYFVRFDIDGEPAGGFRANPAHTEYFRRPDPVVWNQVWFNGQRSAYGLRYYAEKLHRSGWREAAGRMKRFSLSAPLTDGLFPAIYAYEKQEWWGSIPRLNGGKRRIHVPNAAWTATWLLWWHRDLESDQRIMAYVRELADFLTRSQLSSGAIPGWFDLPEEDGANPIAVDTLRESAETAAAGLFLGEMAVITGNIAYKRAVLLASDFLIRQVIPQMKYWDYETFFSCSYKSLEMRDPYTGVLPHNNYSMYWTAHTLLRAYEISGKSRYLKAGEQAMELLNLYQQVWNPPYLSLYTFGGFGVMNTDGEWNDARQAVFAPLYLEYYRVTGDREYFERGVAALRASFALMAIPENRKVSPHTYDAYPTGIMPENFAHAGRDGTHGRSDTGWGEAGALAAAAWVETHYGGLYVDTDRGEAFGIDGCKVQEVIAEEGGLRIRVTEELGTSREVLLRTDRGQSRLVSLDGGAEKTLRVNR